MIRGVLLGMLLLSFPVWVQGATYYINDTGSNAQAGTSTSTPWRTWAHAFSRSTCGDRLIVMDGTYTVSSNGAFSLKKVCTAGAVYTVMAQNERKAFISGSGREAPLLITSSAYITVHGLRVKNVDNAAGIITSNVVATNSNHITFRRLLVTHSNRYFNDHLIQLSNSPYSLLEENELYYFHRHGIMLYGTSNSVVRRNYCNARNYANISGGYTSVSGATNTGDDCVVVYPGNSNIIENNISDGLILKGFSVQANGAGLANKFYGNIAIDPIMGLSVDVRGKGLAMMPRDTIIENMVVIAPKTFGIRSRGAKNTKCNQCMVLSGPNGFVVDSVASTPGDGVYSFFSSNSLVSGNNSGNGWYVTSAIQTWSINSPNSFKNTRNYNPSGSSRWVAPKSLDPFLGTCKVWIPNTSSMKRAGVGGKDIGANIVYRYQNGILTNVRLWDPTTGAFPQGVLISGINTVAGKSLFDVHRRLNVNTNGCPFPTGEYSTKLATPTSLSAF